MGRYVRAVLRSFAARPDIALTLLVRDPRNAADYRAIAGSRAAVAPLRAAYAPRAFDRVWYPWNGMRFRSAAPALVTINDDFAFAYAARGFIARRREQGPVRRAVRDAAHIITISAWSRDVLMRRFALAPERIGVIPLAPDPFFTPGDEPSPFAEPFVLAVGGGEARKNIAFLISAFAQAAAGESARLVLAGGVDAAVGAHVRATANITLLGSIDDAELRRLYRTAAVVAVPSLAEGYGLVAAEAQACGAAVIAANTSALPEAVGDAGVLLDPHDRAAWAQALRRFVRDPPARAATGARAAARWRAVSRDGTADRVFAALADLGHDRP